MRYINSKSGQLAYYFFEDDEYKKYFMGLCTDENADAGIVEYLLHCHFVGKKFDNLDLKRIAFCTDIGKCEALKKILYVSLDHWILHIDGAYFRKIFPISSPLEKYFEEVCLSLILWDEPLSYCGEKGQYHIDVLRQYLNQTMLDRYMRPLWEGLFPAAFEAAPDFLLIIFLLKMLTKEEQDIHIKTEVSFEARALLIECGCNYIVHLDLSQLDGNEGGLYRKVCDTIMKEGVGTLLPCRQDVDKKLFKALEKYLLFCTRNQLIAILQNGGKSYVIQTAHLYLDMFEKLKTDKLEESENARIVRAARLALSLPKKLMEAYPDVWREVLEIADKIVSSIDKLVIDSIFM